MKPDPYISVIMPCYNEQENIARSVQSILDQTFTDFELIVIDDCSTDCSGNIIKHFAQKDSRIIYLKNEKNSGVAIALNKGLRIAKGIFVARIDADDVCEPTRFQKQIDYLKEHPECIICGTFADVFNGKEIVIQGNSQGNIKKKLVKNNPFVHSSVMFKRIIKGKRVFYPETKGFEDYALWIELSTYGDFYIIPEILVHRVDINNIEYKKTWEGFTKLIVYKKLLTYQMIATKRTKYWIYGALCILFTGCKIIVAYAKSLADKLGKG